MNSSSLNLIATFVALVLSAVSIAERDWRESLAWFCCAILFVGIAIIQRDAGE